MKIGATALCKWVDTKEERELYFSFGEYEEATDTDGFGVYDGNVFFYTNEGELLAMVGGTSEDFQVIEILNYNETEEVA
jgi:hypothetical protein